MLGICVPPSQTLSRQCCSWVTSLPFWQSYGQPCMFSKLQYPLAESTFGCRLCLGDAGYQAQRCCGAEPGGCLMAASPLPITLRLRIPVLEPWDAWSTFVTRCFPALPARCWEPAPQMRRGLSSSQHKLSLCITLNSYLWRLLVFAGADGLSPMRVLITSLVFIKGPLSALWD